MNKRYHFFIFMFFSLWSMPAFPNSLHSQNKASNSYPTYKRMTDCIKSFSKISDEDLNLLLNPIITFENTFPKNMIKPVGSGDFGGGYIYKDLFIKLIHEKPKFMSDEASIKENSKKLIERSIALSSLLSSKHFPEICGWVEKSMAKSTNKDLLVIGEAIFGSKLSDLKNVITINQLHDLLNQSIEIAVFSTKKKVSVRDMHEENIVIKDDGTLIVIDLDEFELTHDRNSKELFINNLDKSFTWTSSIRGDFLPLWEMTQDLKEHLKNFWKKKTSEDPVSSGEKLSIKFLEAAFKKIPNSVVNSNSEFEKMMNNINNEKNSISNHHEEL